MALALAAETRWWRPSLGTVLLVLALAAQACLGFKTDEFRKCHQTPFCQEFRDKASGSSDFHIYDRIGIVDGQVHAKLAPSNSSGSDHLLLLKLGVYKGGILRIRIDQENVPGGRSRFQVPDVLVDDLDENRLWLQRTKDEEGSSTFYLSSGHEVVLQHSPFQVHVVKGAEKLVSLNSKGLFHFEQLRQKNESENWEENFRNHRDTRPRGSQSLGFDVTFHGASHVYGIPERATSLSLKPTKGPGVAESEPYRLFNLDVFEYLGESPFGLYGSIPFMLSHGSKQSAGFFWLNAAEMLVDVLAPGWDGSSAKQGIDTHWISESGIIDAFVFIGPRPKDVVQQYTGVTGTMAMPPLFATGYHQCRWNYKDEADVAQVDSKFDEHDIPYDVIWLDIEHTDGKKYFTWDPVLFPNPKEMQDKLAAKGRHMVTIVDPHIKRDDNFALHKEATAKGYYVKDRDGRDYDGWCWPGSSSYLDMVNPEIRSWWADKFSFKNYVGSTPILHIWNDMNEPSVFNGPEGSMPRDNLHFGDIEHRDVHNAYGYYFHMATVQGLMERGEGKERPFVLSRAIYAGTQKVGAVWTGDNTAEWSHLKVSVPMVLSLGLSGVAFSGADVGGFFGNPSPELLTRWYQLGAFYPFFRAHAHLDTKRREPWLFGEPYTSLIRDAVHTRYAHLPYLYTLFKLANDNGLPVMRPLWMEYPSDETTFPIDNEFLVGDGLLVQGVLSEGARSENVYLPGKGPWYDLKTGAAYAGGKHHTVPVTLDSIPVFQRGGAIIPRKDRFRRSTTQMIDDPYTLVVALDSKQEAEGELYIDDGHSYDFKNGAFLHRHFKFADGRLNSSAAFESKFHTPAKDFHTSCKVERIVILGLGNSNRRRALVEAEGQDSRSVELEAGTLALKPGATNSGSNVLVVRLPGVSIAEDWSIKLV